MGELEGWDPSDSTLACPPSEPENPGLGGDAGRDGHRITGKCHPRRSVRLAYAVEQPTASKQPAASKPTKRKAVAAPAVVQAAKKPANSRRVNAIN